MNRRFFTSLCLVYTVLKFSVSPAMRHIREYCASKNGRYYDAKLALSQCDSTVIYSLTELLQIENRNLTTVIEGVRYSLEPSQIEKMLIL